MRVYKNHPNIWLAVLLLILLVICPIIWNLKLAWVSIILAVISCGLFARYVVKLLNTKN